MDHTINWDDIEKTDPEVLVGLRGAIILKIERYEFSWAKSFTPARFHEWKVGRDEDEVVDIADDIHTLLAVEKALGIGEARH